jgi:hypothetical protein
VAKCWNLSTAFRFGLQEGRCVPLFLSYLLPFLFNYWRCMWFNWEWMFPSYPRRLVQQYHRRLSLAHHLPCNQYHALRLVPVLFRITPVFQKILPRNRHGAICLIVDMLNFPMSYLKIGDFSYYRGRLRNQPRTISISGTAYRISCTISGVSNARFIDDAWSYYWRNLIHPRLAMIQTPSEVHLCLSEFAILIIVYPRQRQHGKAGKRKYREIAANPQVSGTCPMIHRPLIIHRVRYRGWTSLRDRYCGPHFLSGITSGSRRLRLSKKEFPTTLTWSQHRDWCKSLWLGSQANVGTGRQ